MTFTINRQISTSSAQPLTMQAGTKSKKSPSVFKLFKKSIGRLIKGSKSSSPKKGKKSKKAFMTMQQSSQQLIKLQQTKRPSRGSGLLRLEAKIQSTGDEQDAHDLVQQQTKLIALKQSAHSLAISRGQSQQQLVGTRRQASAEQLQIATPVVAKFITKNVNQMKSQPLTLGEKLSRWCRQSPAAIFKGCAPEDHFLPFPSADYCDMEVNKRADAELLSAIDTPNEEVAAAKAAQADARDEVVLERYAAGRHGLSPRTRPTGTPEAAAAASKATATLLQEIKGRRSHARLHHLQAKLEKRATQQSLALVRKTPSQPELKALRWMKDQQRRTNTGTTLSMAAGAGSALDINRMRDAGLARVTE